MLLSCLLFFGPTQGRTLQVSFFTDNFSITLPAGYVPTAKVNSWSAPALYGAFHDLEKTAYLQLLDQLHRIKNEKRLNDWLFFLLVHTLHTSAFDHTSPAQIAILNWFVLSKSGYDARLAYFETQVFLYVGTRSFLFEVPYLEEEDKRFVNVSAIMNAEYRDTQFYWPVHVDQDSPKDFSFALEQWPLLPPKPQNQQFKFTFEGEEIQWSAQTDGLSADIMSRFPLLEEATYLEIPPSELTRQTLLPVIQKAIQDKPLREKIRLLVSFTRSAFSYAEDEQQFGTNKPMTAEETLLYPSSDCEDRVALFSQLAQQLIQVPMIAIAWPDHLSIGIAVPDIGGDYVFWKGEKFYICDPTGPQNNSQIGIIPEPYPGQSFEVIQYWPGK